jgi:CheY-like chemotaxis protein/two-component sensor histidine kinase
MDQLRLLAERESQQKSMFLADAAHDLSQPMHAMSLLIEAARQAILREDLVRAKTLMDEVTRAVHVARSSFTAVLEASQLQSGWVKAALGAYDVEKLVSESLEPLEVIAKTKGVRLKLRRPKAGTVAVDTDPVLFSRLIQNLVSNAIKYSDPRKGDTQTVIVGIVSFAERVRIDVLDNGIGISEQNQTKIFQPFFQLANPERNRDKGLGLGLSIVSAIVDLLPEHRLAVRSVEGQWTRFSLEAPRHRGAIELPRVGLAAAGSDRIFDELYAFYIEDDETSTVATTALLSDAGILLEVAASVAEMEVALRDCERRPDLVISDFRLPEGKTAVDVAQIFRARWDEKIPVLVLTGDTMPPSPELIGGATIVLRKPTAPENILNAIQSLCVTVSAETDHEDTQAEGAPE